MPQRKKVFLVDDCPFFVKLCKKQLGQNGFTNVHTFFSGTDLLKNLHQEPDIIFIDYELQDYNGKELLNKAKAFNPAIMVVIISSQTSMHTAIELMNNGAIDYIIKDDDFTARLRQVSYKLVSAFSSYQHRPMPGATAFSEKDHMNIVLRAQEKVRNEISRELHDNIKQLLASSKLYLETAKHDPGNRVELINESKSIIENAMSEIRTMSHNLSSLFLQSVDLNMKLPALIQQMKMHGGFVVHDAIDIADFNDALTPRMQHDILRILQELFNNIVKYSQASNVFVKMKESNEGLNIILKDDGKGFDLEQDARGQGLVNIYGRIARLSGSYELDTAPGDGCCWHITVPWNAPYAPATILLPQQNGNTIEF